MRDLVLCTNIVYSTLQFRIGHVLYAGLVLYTHAMSFRHVAPGPGQQTQEPKPAQLHQTKWFSISNGQPSTSAEWLVRRRHGLRGHPGNPILS